MRTNSTVDQSPANRWTVKVLVAAAVVVAGALVFAGWGSRQDPVVADPASHQATAIVSPRSSDHVSAVPNDGAPAPDVALPTAIAKPSDRLQRQFTAAKDWRVFALDAMNRPDEGGYFYARFVAGACATSLPTLVQLGRNAVDHDAAAAATLSTTRLAALDHAAALCATFSQGEAGALAKSVAERAKDGRDPVLKAADGLDRALTSTDRQAIRTAAESLLQTQDPIALSQRFRLQRLMASDEEAAKTRGLWFDGRVYSPADPASYADLNQALTLATCNPDRPCLLDSTMMASCLQGRSCASDRLAFIKETYDPARMQRVDELAARARAALSQSNVSAFVR